MVVSLQTRYLEENLTDLSNGFLNWETTLDDLTRYADLENSYFAQVNGEMAGYILSFDFNVAHKLSRPKVFFSILDQLKIDKEPVTSYRLCIGQVLVDISFRNRGIAKSLMATFIKSAREKYDLRLAGVHHDNRPSYHLHHKSAGMKLITAYGESGEFELMILDFRDTIDPGNRTRDF